MDELTKSIGLKKVGGNEPAITLAITPGTTAMDILQELGLGPGFELSDASNSQVFGRDDVVYAMVRDGDMLHCSANVVAGSKIITGRENE